MAWVAWALALAAAAGCNKMEASECSALSSQAFDVINSAHVCADDSECVPTNWPGCTKAVSSKNKAKIDAFKSKFDAGKCVDEKTTCREAPEIYCKQGLCVFRELAGQTNPAK